MNDLKCKPISRLFNDKLDELVFIIDSISTAYAVAIIANKKAIHCIYECKEITWRNADFVKLYDLILSSVTFLSKEIINVPHPFLKPSKTIFGRIASQRKFAKDIRRLRTLNPQHTYVSSTISSLLIANKNKVNSILIDEGIDSILARNRLGMRGNKLAERLKIILGDLLLSFRFSNRTPQVTLTNDTHPSVVAQLDYRNFNSTDYELALINLKQLMAGGDCNILVLLKGPSYGAKGHPDEKDKYDQKYIDFNLSAIRSILKELPVGAKPIFYLKSHPSLGNSAGKLDALIGDLQRLDIVAHDVLAHIDFLEASSLPAEGLLRYLNFHYVFALDASSLLWNIAHHGEVKCFLALNAVIDFSASEGNLHLELYKRQRDINNMLGGHIRYYDVNN